MRIIFGLVAGVACSALVFWFLVGNKPCFGRCGALTICKDGLCVAPTVKDEKSAAGANKTAGKTRRALSGNSSTTLSPDDERMVTMGDSLGRSEKVNFAESDTGKELDENDLDRVFASARPSVLRCITDAIGDAPLEHGHLEIGFRVEKSGKVSKVNVKAAKYFEKKGLYRCVRSAVEALTFPASDGSNVVTYPFDLN